MCRMGRYLHTSRATLAALVYLALSAAFAQPTQVSFTRHPIHSNDGQSHTLIATVTNQSSSTVTFIPTARVDEPLVLGPAPEPLTLGPGQTHAVVLSILVPIHTPPGEYGISLEATDEFGTVVTAETAAHVRERTEVTVETTTQQPGREPNQRTIQMVVHNRGNTSTELRLQATTTPAASTSITPETATLEAGESLPFELTISSPFTTSGQQRFTVTAISSATGEPLAVSQGAFSVLTDRAVVSASHRQLRFSVRVDYSSGPNFSRTDLRGFGVSVRGSGLINPNGNQRVRMNLSTRGFTTLRGSAAYTSDTLAVILGDAARDYSRFSQSTSGYGLTVDGTLPEHGVTFGSYLLADRNLTSLTGIGAQVSATAQGLQGALQATYDPRSNRAILSATGSINALHPNLGASINQSTQKQPELEPEEPLSEIRVELEELEGIEPNDETADRPEEELEESVMLAASSGGLEVRRLEFSGEGAVDTSGGVGASLQTTLGVGPATLTGQVTGTTEGFRGAPYSELSFGVGGNATVVNLAGLSVGLAAQYRNSDRFTTIAGHTSSTDTLSIGAAVNAQAFSVSTVYTSTLNTLVRAGDWSRNQRLRLALDTGFQGGTASASLSWRGAESSASGGELTSSSVRFNTRVRTTVAGAQLATGAEAEYDLIAGELVRLEAEALAGIKNITALAGDLRFGVRYRMKTDSSTTTGLIRWSGFLTPNINANAGVSGILTHRDHQVSGAVITSLGSSFALSNNHRLGINGQFRLQGNGNHSASLAASYTVPFSVPIGRIEGHGDVQGRLVTAEGTPVPGVELRIGRAAVITNEDGAFEVIGLPAGQHTLLATSGIDGLVSQPQLPTLVTVPDGATAELLFTLQEAATVQGAVIVTVPTPEPGVIFGSGDQTRDALAAVNLRLALIGDDNEYTAITNTLGAFTFVGVMPGTYDLVLMSDLGPLYRAEILTPKVELAPGQSVSVELLVHPLPRQVEFQQSGHAGDRNKE